MTPFFDLRCKNCGFILEDVKFPDSRINWKDNQIIIKCDKCGTVGQWERLMGTPSIPPDGRYSYNDKKE